MLETEAKKEVTWLLLILSVCATYAELDIQENIPFGWLSSIPGLFLLMVQSAALRKDDL